ncbi:hypothetical protein MTO96_027288, partial [Rhipicephalus appendiculatus]
AAIASLPLRCSCGGLAPERPGSCRHCDSARVARGSSC